VLYWAIDIIHNHFAECALFVLEFIEKWTSDLITIFEGICELLRARAVIIEGVNGKRKIYPSVIGNNRWLFS